MKNLSQALTEAGLDSQGNPSAKGRSISGRGYCGLAPAHSSVYACRGKIVFAPRFFGVTLSPAWASGRSDLKQGPAHMPQTPEPFWKQANILIADDEPDMREIFA